MTRTLEEIDQALEAIEQAQNDQLVPGVFNINAQGQIEEKLAGHLEASGIDLHVAGSTVEAAAINMVRWLLEGLPRAEIYSAGKAQPGLTLSTLDAAGATKGAIVIGTDIISLVSGAANGVLLNHLGESTFLQLALEGKLVLEVGATVITWPGASKISDPHTILGREATGTAIPLATAAVTSGFAFYAFIENNTTSSFQVLGNAEAVPPEGHQESVLWARFTN